jgi:hypothetical protein
MHGMSQKAAAAVRDANQGSADDLVHGTVARPWC